MNFTRESLKAFFGADRFEAFRTDYRPKWDQTPKIRIASNLKLPRPPALAAVQAHDQKRQNGRVLEEGPSRNGENLHSLNESLTGRLSAPQMGGPEKVKASRLGNARLSDRMLKKSAPKN